MSVEFEKVVLEKLDELSKDMRETKEKVEQLEEKADNNTATISSLTEKVNNNTVLINNLTQDVRDTQDILKIQGQNLAKFEHECMLKLNTLFDSYSANSESHAVFSKAIAVLNAENYDYKQRISALEDYFNGAKILATN